MIFFSSKGISFPDLVDIKWRLDYTLQSKIYGRVNMPLYFITLKVKDNGIIRDIEMLATLEELQHMLAKVSTFRLD